MAGALRAFIVALLCCCQGQAEPGTGRVGSLSGALGAPTCCVPSRAGVLCPGVEMGTSALTSVTLPS